MPKGIYKRIKLLSEEHKNKLRLFRIGKKLSEETKLKIGLAHKGKTRLPFSKEWKENISKSRKGTTAWNKGKVGIWSKVQLQKLREYGLKWRGNLHPQYIKDRTKLKKSEKKHLDVQYKIWMLAVKKRDNWKCRLLNSDCKGRLESHHILDWVNYPELRYDINNGITLCHAHHPRGRAKEKRLSPYFMELVSVSE